MPEPLEDGRLDRVGDARCPDVVDGRGWPGRERAEKLLDVERDPVGSLVDRADRLVVDGSIVEEDPGHHRGLLDGQPRQTCLLGQPLREEARSPAADGGVGRELVGPERRDDEQREIDETPGDGREDVQAQIVGPLEVLEREERRLCRGLGEDVREVEDEHPTCVAGRRPDRLVRLREPADQRLPDRSQLRRATHRPGEVEDDRVRDVPVGRGDGSGGRVEADDRRVTGDRSQHPRLPDPRVAAQQEEAAASVPDLGEPPLGESEELVPTDEDRTDDGGDPRHARSLRARRPVTSVERPTFRRCLGGQVCAGATLGFTWNTLSGSHSRFRAARRASFASP